MRETALAAGVPIVTGDTKVVEKGAVDEVIVNTSGIGLPHPSLSQNLETLGARAMSKGAQKWLLDANLRAGDTLILSGTVGDHGIALLAFKEGYEFEGDLRSDIAPLNKLAAGALAAGGVVAMKDPTRGGLAAALNEFARKSHVGIEVEESKIPVNTAVKAACEFLGIDALEVGNEGKLVLAVLPEYAEDVLAALRKTAQGRCAEVIGTCVEQHKGTVVLQTDVAGRRILDFPLADPVPRIC
jgi:hydrogenase expression/formation protein HypE